MVNQNKERRIASHPLPVTTFVCGWWINKQNLLLNLFSWNRTSFLLFYRIYWWNDEIWCYCPFENNGIFIGHVLEWTSNIKSYFKKKENNIWIIRCTRLVVQNKYNKIYGINYSVWSIHPCHPSPSSHTAESVIKFIQDDQFKRNSWIPIECVS